MHGFFSLLSRRQYVHSVAASQLASPDATCLNTATFSPSRGLKQSRSAAVSMAMMTSHPTIRLMSWLPSAVPHIPSDVYPIYLPRAPPSGDRVNSFGYILYRFRNQVIHTHYCSILHNNYFDLKVCYSKHSFLSYIILAGSCL